MPRRIALYASLLFLATALVFSGALFNGFAHHDDEIYILHNPHVLEGLSWSGLVWAFTTGHAANWHPLTWITLQANASLTGTNPWGFHLVDVLLHAGAATALFLALHALTGRMRRSLLVGAIFAVHPYRVESVAWAAERKDVLAGLFAMLALLAYARYAKSGSRKAYAWCLAAFSLSLLSKPMIVTFPFLLLLLDVWPLRRSAWSAGLASGPPPEPEESPSNDSNGRPGARDASTPATQTSSTLATHGRTPTSSLALPANQMISWPRLWLEKFPMIAIALAVSIVTFIVQRHGGMVRDIGDYTLAQRVENALVSYVRYAAGLAWPVGLSPYYPHPGDWPAWAWGGAASLLLVAGTFAAINWRARPWLAIGGLWYLGTLVPVIGLVQVATLAMADRYTYLPTIGLILAAVWSIPAPIIGSWAGRAVAAGIVVALSAMTVVQVGYWRDAQTIWNRAARVTPENAVVLTNLGTIAQGQKRMDDAERLFRRAVELRPNSAPAQYDLGLLLAQKKPPADLEAEEHFRVAADADPRFAEARHNMGVFYGQHGRWNDAETWFRKALEISPDSAKSHAQLGLALVHLNRLDEAVAELKRAAELDANQVRARLAIFEIYRSQGRAELAGPVIEELATGAQSTPKIRDQYVAWLTATGQAGKATEFEREWKGVR